MAGYGYRVISIGYRLSPKNKYPCQIEDVCSGYNAAIDYSCAVMFSRKALKIGNKCELYSVEDKKNTHSWYTAGMFLETRDKNKGLDKLLSYVESL